MTIIEAMDGKKVNASMVLVIVAALLMPVIADGVALAGYPEWAALIRRVAEIFVGVGAGGGVIGLADKARKSSGAD